MEVGHDYVEAVEPTRDADVVPDSGEAGNMCTYKLAKPIKCFTKYCDDRPHLSLACVRTSKMSNTC
jgi:hypothetical protein